MEGKLLLDALLEVAALLDSEGICLGDDRHDIDYVRELLQDNNVNRLQGVAGRLDEEQAAVDASVLDVALALSSELLSQVRRVLVLDVLDNGVPASVVVDKVAIAGGVDNVEPQPDAVLLDDVGHGLDLGGGADGLLGLQTTLGVDEVRSEDGVDQGRLSQTGLACRRQNVSERSSCKSRRGVGGARRPFESPEGSPNIPTQMTLNWKPRFNSFFSI